MTRVLVVHHDIDIADQEVDSLRRLGYDVQECTGPTRNVCPALAGRPCYLAEAADVLVYDSFACGDTDGAQSLIENLRDLHPYVPIVLTASGLELSWTEVAGSHGVTPLAGSPTGARLHVAIQEAIAGLGPSTSRRSCFPSDAGASRACPTFDGFCRSIPAAACLRATALCETTRHAQRVPRRPDPFVVRHGRPTLAGPAGDDGGDAPDIDQVARPRALRGGHRHRGPLPAADGLSKMFCACSTDYDGAAAEHPHLPGLPGAARAPCRRSTGGPSSTSSRPGWRSARPYPDGDALGPQELLLPGSAQGLPDQPVRPAARVEGPARRSTPRRAVSRSGITRAHLEEDTAKLDPRDRRATASGSASSTSTAPGRRSWRSSPSPDIRTAERRAATPRSCSCSCARSGRPTRTWSAARCGSRRTSRSGRAGTEPFGTRVEVKNMNSFRAVERAIAFEIERQAAALDARRAARSRRRAAGTTAGSATYRMRLKEDLGRLPLLPGARPAAAARRCGLARRASGRRLPELPAARRAATGTTLGLSAYDAAVLVADPAMAAAFEAILAADPALPAKAVANWVTGEYAAGSRDRRAGESASSAGPEPPARRPACGRGRRARSRGPTPARSWRATSRPGTADRRDHRGARLPPDLRRRRARRRSSTPPGGEPGGRRRLPRRQAAGLGFLVGQVMKATRGQANAALAAGRAVASAWRRQPGT